MQQLLRMERLTRGEIDMNDDDRKIGSKNALARTIQPPGIAEQRQMPGPRSQRPTAKPLERDLLVPLASQTGRCFLKGT